MQAHSFVLDAQGKRLWIQPLMVDMLLLSCTCWHSSAAFANTEIVTFLLCAASTVAASLFRADTMLRTATNFTNIVCLVKADCSCNHAISAVAQTSHVLDCPSTCWYAHQVRPSAGLFGTCLMHILTLRLAMYCSATG